MTSLAARIRAGHLIVLDGGVGSEVQRRVGMLDPTAWSGFSHLEHQKVIYDIHRDYIRAGAQVITANTFCSAKHILECVGRGDEFEHANRRAMELARAARDSQATDPVWIAGSLSTIPPLDRPATIPVGPQIRDNYRRQAAVLAEAGADLLLIEMALDTAGASILRDACLESGLPVWIGFSASLTPDGEVQAFRAPGKYTDMRDESFEEMIAAVATSDVAVAGVMHTKLPIMPAALTLLAQTWTGPTMAYASTGHASAYLWHFEGGEDPTAYAEHARGWIDELGVQIVGGCCGTGPEHITAVSLMVRSLERDSAYGANGGESS